ncbi:multicopper oxidase-domain-containing protein [Camillea tinctor]|nr:multicopper oxidase-domain-containing protein [Camillea tinctor]
MRGHRSTNSASGLMTFENEGSPRPELSWSSRVWKRSNGLPAFASEKRPRRTVSLCVFVTSLVCFCILALALGLGLGLGWPRYKTVYASAPINLSSYYGIPENLDVVPIDKLINSRELELDTDFTVSHETQVREYVFNVSQAYAAPDGFQKPMILVNGQSPGPLIEANTGDTIRVHVNNMMANWSTTIHWHGIDQKRTTWMDGVTSVSQCGIPPGQNFTYEFQVADQRGTFWWHAHLSVQYTDGMYGPIIIHDPEEMVPKTDDDKIMFVTDVYHTYGSILLTSYLNPTSKWVPFESGVEPLADNILLNGQHTYDCTVNSTTYPGPESSAPSSADKQQHPPFSPPNPPCTGGQLYTTRVRAGQTVRLRLINASSFLSYWLSIDNHTLTIVELDGVEIEPIPAQRGVYLNLGQRASVLLTADQEPGLYRIRATLPQTCFLPYAPYTSAGLADSAAYAATGVLAYEGVPLDAAPLGSKGNTSNPFGVENNGARGQVWEGCDDIPFDAPKPMRKVPAYEVAEANSHYFEYAFRQAQDVNRIFINKTAYAPLPHNATLWKALEQHFAPEEDNSYSSWDFGLNQQVFLVPDADKGAQIVINSRDAMEHPWHLQDSGHTFQIVGWGKGYYGSSPSSDNTTTTGTTWNLENPMRRDTVTVPAFSHVVIRFLADNPGVWALHCHVAWHMEGGMFLSLAERPSDLVDLVARMDPSTRQRSLGFCDSAAAQQQERPVVSYADYDGGSLS